MILSRIVILVSPEVADGLTNHYQIQGTPNSGVLVSCQVHKFTSNQVPDVVTVVYFSVFNKLCFKTIVCFLSC